MGHLVGSLYGIDHTIFLVVNRTLQNPVFDLLMPALSDKWIGFLIGAGVIKHTVQRIRPCHVIAEVHLLAGCTHSFAMPSNHASNMFALATVTGTMLPRWRWVVLSLAGSVAYSRVYLGVHYPTDVLVGAVWGAVLGWGLTVAAR